MATPNSTPSNAFDTQETVNYIRALYGQYMAAQQQYNKFQTSLTNLQIQKKAIGEEFARTDSDRSVAENNLNNAKLAKSKVETIAEFFKSRVAVTQSMVDNAYNMAVQAFEATEFLNKNAQERVETISNLVNTLNTSTGSDSSQQWSDIFTAAVSAALAQGVTAFKAGNQAVISAFSAYVSNQQINARSVSYYKQFSEYERQLVGINARLSNELEVIRKRYQTLKAKNSTLDIQVNEMNKKVMEWEFKVAQSLAEFNAAQQGASYTFTPAASPAG